MSIEEGVKLAFQLGREAMKRAPKAEALLLAFSDMPRRVVALQLAEMPGECDLLFVGDVLIAEDQHDILVHARLDRGNLLLGERPSAIDTPLVDKNASDVPIIKTLLELRFL